MPLTPAAKAIRKRILSCTRCDLRAACTRPVPWSGPTPLRHLPVAVIGEAPGAEEDAAGRPFVGRSGQMLRQMLTDAGLYPDYMGWCNVVSCRPGVMNRDPKVAEIAACSANLKLQLAAMRPNFLLLVGRFSLQVFRPGAKLSDAHGRPFKTLDQTYTCYPIYHPAALLHTGNNADLRQKMVDDLARFRTFVYGRTQWSEDCEVCGAPVDRYDPQGVAFCFTHYPTHYDQLSLSV